MKISKKIIWQFLSIIRQLLKTLPVLFYQKKHSQSRSFEKNNLPLCQSTTLATDLKCNISNSKKNTFHTDHQSNIQPPSIYFQNLKPHTYLEKGSHTEPNICDSLSQLLGNYDSVSTEVAQPR